jgi:hypothetical protein
MLTPQVVMAWIFGCAPLAFLMRSRFLGSENKKLAKFLQHDASSVASFGGGTVFPVV